MASAKNITYLNYGTAWAQKPFQKGWQRSRGTAEVPSGDATCTIANIPNLGTDSEVLISQQAISGATSHLIEIASGRTNGPVGTITVGTADGSSVTSDTPFMFQIVNE